MAAAPRATTAMAPAAMKIAEHTRQRIAARLLPFLFILYVTNYLDRTSIAYAALGMSRDLGFGDRVIGLGAGIFFISYLALQIPGAILVGRWSARRSIGMIMTAWGSVTALTGLVHSPGQLYLARFILGAAEAGFFPGVIVYLSHWFICEDRAKATSNFMAAIPLSVTIGSPLAGWILGHKWLGIQGWRWLFVLEGLPAILLGAAAFFYLTDWPHQAAWLAPHEREWIEQKLKKDKPGGVRSITAWQAIRSRTILLLASVAFLNYFANYCVIFWFPTILKSRSGLSDVRLGLLGALPYAVALIAMLINGWHSDKNRERRGHSAVPQFIAAAGLLGLITLPGSTQLTVFWFSLVCMVLAFLPVFWAIPTEILGEPAAAAGAGLINAIGSLAGFVGPYVFGYLHTRTGSFSCGLALTMLFALASGVLILRIPVAPHHISSASADL